MNRDEELQFAAFVDGSARRLLRTATLLVGGDHGHAEDLLQTALERTARRWTRLDGVPEAYARVVLARLATDRWRARRSRVHEVLINPPEREQPDLAGDLAVRHALVAGLRELAPRQRAVLVLRYYEDLSEAQTAEALGISVSTVKSTAHRGLARLGRLVPDLGPFPKVPKEDVQR